MIQIFILGSSSAYGVGAESGWADLIKQRIHSKMYGVDGVGEKYEVFNFGKSGATIDFVTNTFPIQLKNFGRGGKIIAVVSVGGNNAKAIEKPTNYVSTLEEYQSQMDSLMDLLQSKCDVVVAVGSGYYDESKVRPKISPLTGKKSYFSNERKKEFEQTWKKMCAEKDIPFIEVAIPKQEWIAGYLYTDGLHANQKGQQYVANQIMQLLDQYL